MRVILSPNPFRDKGLKAARSAMRVLHGCGIETVVCLPFSLDGSGQLDLPEGLVLGQLEEELPRADVLICFGGDGTILHAAKGANQYNVPILGVNTGSVGFMAELEQSDMSILARLASGKYEMEARMMLDVKVLRDRKLIFEEIALNDAVVTKGAVARVAELAVLSDKVLISEFSGDGVIASTPTGSTAYSMAAGGPIVEPTAENIIVTPICPHALHAKSFVLGHERVVEIRASSSSRKNVFLSVDGGRAVKLTGNDVVRISKSERKTKLIKLAGRNFYELIHQKLGRARQ